MAFHDEMVEKYGYYEGFIYKPLSRRNARLVNGIGINDLEFVAEPTIEGIRIKHPGYTSWKSMLYRCNDYDLVNHPTYTGVICCDTWKYCSAFILWYKENYIKGYALDKDLILLGNKMYHPNLCMYVPREVNAFLTSADAARGEYPLGVNFNKANGKFRARVNKNGKSVSLGCFNNTTDAHKAWQIAKIEQAKHLMDKYGIPQLSRIVSGITDDIKNNRETKSI